MAPLTFVALALPVGCAACGGTSECHADAQQGPCHIPCQPERVAELLTASRQIDVLVKGLGDQDPAIARERLNALAVEVDARAFASYQFDRNVIQLKDCRNVVVAEWALPSSVRLRVT
jgi:hypothetical protein